MKDERILRKYSKDAVVLESRSPEEIISAMQVSIQQAYKDELLLYAPKHLAEAEKAFDKARALLSSLKHVKAMQEGIYAEKVLQAAYVVKKKVARVLSHTLERKKRLEDLGVKTVYPLEYGKLAMKVREAIEAIEDGDMDKGIEAESDLLEPMGRLEVELVKVVRLEKAREAIGRAATEGAEKIAPKSWAKSQEAMTRALLYIEQYPRDDAGTLAKGEAAYHAALHALFMAREAKDICALGKKELWEEIALEMEAHLSLISTSLGVGNLKYMSLRDQAKAIAEKANAQSQTISMAKAAEAAAVQVDHHTDIPVVPGEVCNNPEVVPVSGVRSMGAKQSATAPAVGSQISMQSEAEVVAHRMAQPKKVASPVKSGGGQLAAPAVNEPAFKPSPAFVNDVPATEGVQKRPSPAMASQALKQGITHAAPQENGVTGTIPVREQVASVADSADVPAAPEAAQQGSGTTSASQVVPMVESESPRIQGPAPLSGKEGAVQATSLQKAGAGGGTLSEESDVKADKPVNQDAVPLEGASDRAESQYLSLKDKKAHAETSENVTKVCEVSPSSGELESGKAGASAVSESREGFSGSVSE